MTAIHFCKMPFLDMNYQNVIDFSSEPQRLQYFESRNPLTIEGNIKYDGERTIINVNKPIGDLYIYDYLYFMDNDSPSGKRKRYFYFITNLEMKTKTNTNVYLKLDVWTTYYFDYVINPSFVDRCHVDRWRTVNGELMPTGNQLEEEGLNIGEYVIKDKEELCTINKSVVIASSTPMGYVPNFKPQGGGGSDSSLGGSYSGGGDWENGIISSKGFRFIKGFEGFSPTLYYDSGGVATIGYGITASDGENYTKLVNAQPVSEEMAAQVFYDSINNKYGKKIVSACKSIGVTNQNQFDALCSLSYNCGYGVVTNGTSLTEAIAKNPNDETTIRAVWENFRVHDRKGNLLAGLIARRKQECNMFFGKDVEMRAIQNLNGGTVTENNGDGWMPTDKSADNMDVSGYKSFSNSLGDGFLCPVKNATVSSVYGYRVHPITGERKLHHGTDISAPAGTPQVASKSGVVSANGYHSSMGNYIYIDLDDGNQLRLMHFKEPSTLSVGTKVARGQVVGYTGTTGGSTGNHCHWELRNADRDSVNPAPSLKKGDKV